MTINTLRHVFLEENAVDQQNPVYLFEDKEVLEKKKSFEDLEATAKRAKRY